MLSCHFPGGGAKETTGGDAAQRGAARQDDRRPAEILRRNRQNVQKEERNARPDGSQNQIGTLLSTLHTRDPALAGFPPDCCA